MKKCIGLVCVLLFSLAGACSIQGFQNVVGSGKIVSEDRTVSGVQGVALGVPGDLAIELGDQETLQVEAEDNLLPYIETSVRNGRLEIRTRPNTNFRPTQPLHFRLVVKGLDTIEDSSLGNITVPQLKANRFTVKISSGGSINLAGLDASTLDAQLSSLGNLVIGAGQVGQQTITISSSGAYQAGELRSQTAVVRISSLGSATLWVTDRLEAHLSSSGNVNYYGSPKVTQETSSLGKVVSLGTK